MPTRLVKRSDTWENFRANWCPECKKVTDMEPVPTGMPGINCQKCPGCKFNYQINLLEDGDDMLTVPAHLVMMSERKGSNG